MIQYIPHQQIDLQKWDNCVEQASNKLVYARSALLNALVGTWDALVLDDYVAVMPLIKRKKWGIEYLYQPAFIQQSGIFGTFNDEVIKLFLTAAKARFRFAEINLNHANECVEATRKSNQIISLHQSYTELKQGYSNSLLRKLKQAEREALTYTSIEPSLTIRSYQKLYGKRFAHIKPQNYQALIQFCEANSHWMISRGLFIQDVLIASIVALKDDHRIYLISPVLHFRDRYSFAGHALFDQLIQEFADQPLLLDFEGSDLPGVQAFNKGFGAKDQPYYGFRWNQLPWPLALFKR